MIIHSKGSNKMASIKRIEERRNLMLEMWRSGKYLCASEIVEAHRKRRKLSYTIAWSDWSAIKEQALALR